MKKIRLFSAAKDRIIFSDMLLAALPRIIFNVWEQVFLPEIGECYFIPGYDFGVIHRKQFSRIINRSGI
jgi:hypothetical protein